MSNHKPATALPWVTYCKTQIVSDDKWLSVGLISDPADAAFASHACNAYPELVEALKWMREEYARLPHSLGYTFTHLPKVDALLAKLGEM